MAIIVDAQKKISMELNLEYEGTTQVVLVENNSEGVYSGRSRLDKLVYLDGENIEIGDFVEVKITEARTWSLTGEVQKKINYEIEGQLIEH